MIQVPFFGTLYQNAVTIFDIIYQVISKISLFLATSHHFWYDFVIPLTKLFAEFIIFRIMYKVILKIYTIFGIILISFTRKVTKIVILFLAGGRRHAPNDGLHHGPAQPYHPHVFDVRAR